MHLEFIFKNTQRWGINRQYGVGKLKYGGSYEDTKYSEGNVLQSENNVMNIVMRTINTGRFPNNLNGIYMVLFSRLLFI